MPDPTFANADTSDSSLENFFSRPIKIASYSWGTGTSIFETFNPWQLFFENPRVINRISNYNLLRCKLCVKFMLNGNGFHYGRAIASYTPLHNLDEFTRDRAFFSQDIIGASQRPHVYLDPTTSQGGSLCLPFCWYENALNIPLMEWRDMGDMHIHGMQNLKHANGASDAVTISVFAWAEDVSLSIPTANEPGALSPQMSEPYDIQASDEYGTGPISKPAGFVAKIAGALENVPAISPFAKATQMAASAVSNIASMFGYSRPVVLEDIKPYKPTYVGNMANTNVPDSATKLTLDAKQELTIDSRTFGLGGSDEMTIKSIACRESYLTTFAWPVNAPTEEILWNTEVSPVLWDELSDTGNELHFPACCFATLPFKYWRGTMKFRFQIVASAFHKGRLKIVYDPSFPTTNEYNTNYTHVIDLAKERDFTVDIGWGQERSFVEHRRPGLDDIPFSYTPLGSVPMLNANGILSVYVVNELTVPNSTANNDIQVNVFISAGDDFEVAAPDSSLISSLAWFKTPSGDVLDTQSGPCQKQIALTLFSITVALLAVVVAFLTRMVRKIDTTQRDIKKHISGEVLDTQSGMGGSHPDADHTNDEDEPMKMEASEHLAAWTSPTDHTADVFFGDPVTSFRQCLKRYAFHTAYALDQEYDSSILATVNTSDFPYYRGYAPGAVHLCNVPEWPTPYNHTVMTLLNYITPAFVCRRGGMRWKYYRNGGGSNGIGWMQGYRSTSPGYFETSTELFKPSEENDGTRRRQLISRVRNTWDGAHATAANNNPVLELEFPYYNNVRFTSAKIADVTSGTLEGTQRAFHRIDWTANASDENNPFLFAYCATAEDFTLGFFTGAPVAYRVTYGLDPPAKPPDPPRR